MTWRAGVDLLSLGATKNGAINAEALIAFDDTLAAQLPFLMKRGGQVLSKARFVSAQIERYLADDLWLERARAANAHAADACARRLAATGHRDRSAGRDQHALRAPAGTRRRGPRRGPFRFYTLGTRAAIRLPARTRKPAGIDALVALRVGGAATGRARSRRCIHGWALACSAGAVRSRRSPSAASARDAARAQEMQVIDLNFRMAQDLIPILQPLLEPGGVITGTDDVLLRTHQPGELRADPRRSRRRSIARRGSS